MINKPILISFIIVFGLFTAGVVLEFNVQLGRTIGYFDLDGEKRLIDTAMSYIKRAYGASESETEKAAVKADFDFVNGRQAYTWLFGEFENRLKTRTLLYTAGFAGALFMIGFALCFAMIQQYNKPLRSVLSTLTRYSRDGTIEEVDVKGTKRMKTFIGEINAVMSELRQVRISEKVADSFENWQGSARIILHEVKNKLSPLSLLLDDMRLSNRDEDMGAAIEELYGKTEAMRRMISNFKDLSSLPEPALTTVRIGDLVKGMIGKEHWSDKVSMGVGFVDFSLYSDPFYLEVILSNLVRNGIEACADKGQCVTVGCTGRVVTIRDRGEGIGEEITSKIGRPGFTTKTEGHGMGLFIVKELCRMLDLSFVMESVEGKGTQVHVGFGNGKA
jgi:signal transduction histidine kinase